MRSRQCGDRLSRHTLLTLVWVGAFFILGMLGLQIHSAETASVLVTPETQKTAEISESVAPVPVTSDEEIHAVHGLSPQSWHLDLLVICALIIMAGILPFVTSLRHPWQRPHLRPLREPVVSVPRTTIWSRPLLLLLSISRI